MSQLRAPSRYSMQAPSASSRGEKTWTLKATYVEIYNEQLRDLLVPDHVPAHERGTVTIREDVKGNIILTGLRQVEINSVEDLMNALNFGSTLRQTDATAINARSSRSHAVFSLNLVQRKNKLQDAKGPEKRFSVPIEAMTGAETWVTTDSKLHFVDLAGSERLKNTGAQGERAKEGISINAGLAALGKVISQLSSRQAGAHVSYRDSKLTRLLQDSLGGNAITYMVACVTPPEFHLSETLNTVQYAQRARAIQSKPRIQQVEEGDKQALIDRLKAEVAFLREQIRSAERGGGDRRAVAAGERSERQNEREAELQNQLLDSQENYTTLSQRHAKLIAEMAKARDNEFSENQQHEDTLGDTATERLNRSNSFAQAVEQVVLEYEKTIQSLEQSLSSTRATLANTETSLLEKESKCAYTETINTQLQARLQKLMDREASTENYLHDLESKLDGHTSGEEKNATIIMELRKEIARVRENEASCEDYISTLEERLAEADQDAELMQREIDRLEQVIERQRSLGKLDSLLYELDHIQQDVKPEVEPDAVNGTVHRRGNSRSITDHSRSQSHASRQSHKEEPIPESGEEDIEEEADDQGVSTNGTLVEDTSKPSQAALDVAHEVAEEPASPAQSKFVADKLDTVTQELLGLRVEHETTLSEFDLLQAKYEEALRALAELQDVVDEAKHPGRQRDSMLSVVSPVQTRPTSFISDARSSEPKDGGRFSSRSLSSELTSAMESPATVHDSSDTDSTVHNSDTPHVSAEDLTSGDLAHELHRLKAIAAAKEVAERELADRYAQLEAKHHETLDIVEELKTEVAKAQAATNEASSPRSSTPVIRRKSSQNVMIIDRAHRSFASLRNIAAENFEGQPDVMQNFELNLNAAMHELHARSERIQELEADVATAKKEMETKMTIISGLTRERSSLKASPMDMAVVSSLREQLEKNEKQLKQMQDAHAAREKELETQLDELRGTMMHSPEEGDSHARDLPEQGLNGSRVAELEAELVAWESKHQEALESMRSTEAEMKKTIDELETQVAELREPKAGTDSAGPGDRAKQENLISFLRSEIDEYKAIINSNATKVLEVEQQHVKTKALLESATRDRDQASSELDGHKELVQKLEAQIFNHEEAIKTHQASLSELQATHTKELDELQATHTKELDELRAQHDMAVDDIHAEHAKELDELKASVKQDHESRLAALTSEHDDSLKSLEAELTEAREDLMKVATQVAFALGLDVSVERISDRIQDLINDQQELAQEQKKRAELQTHVGDLTSINDTVMRDLEVVKASLGELLGDQAKAPVSSVSEQLAVVKKKMTDLENKNRKNSRLVEELEDQLQNNFDQVQITNNRLSTLQTEKSAQLDEANAARKRLQSELDTLKEEHASLQVSFTEARCLDNGLTTRQAKFEAEGLQRNNSLNGANGAPLRKSASVSSLPSPPPAIPLPPLPGSSAPSPPNAPGHPASPTARPPSKDLAFSQIQEDQEARIRTIEKHLFAEKQLTQTLEEALTDLERQQKKLKSDCDAWRRRASDLETELKELKEKPQQDNRWSLHQVEEERKKRRDAEIARAHLEERMNAISKQKKKKGSLNCF
jgi:kinesin family protein 4/21/27